MMEYDYWAIIAAAMPVLFNGALITVYVSLTALAIGLVSGTVLGVLNCNHIKAFPVNHVIAAYVAVIRGTPLFVQLLIVYFAIPEILGISLSPLKAGVCALSLNSAAYLTEIIRGSINAIALGQWEACQVLGYRTTQALRFVVLPQAMRNALPAMTNEFVALIKESSILMMLGVAELTKVSKDIVARELKPMEIYLLAALMYFVMTSVIAQFSKFLEGRGHEHH